MPQAKPNQLRKMMIIILIAILTAIFLVHAADAIINGRSIEYSEYALVSDKVSAELDGRVLAFVSDLHAISEKDLTAVAGRISERGADILLLGGDYSDSDSDAINMRILSSIRPPDGIYGVEGNHDRWREVSELMRQNGIQPLDNEGVRVGGGLYIAGVRDLWNDGADVSKALSGKAEGDFAILVAHNPDVAMQSDIAKADYTVSGHTHGGQIALFGFWRPALAHVSKYGALFKGGYAQTPGGAHVLVSRGTGNFAYILRVFSRPEVIFITLKRQ